MKQTIGALLLIAFTVVLPSFGVTRHYYIAAEEQVWDYAPSGLNLVESRSIPAPWASRTKFPKVRYIEYTDDTFTVRKPQPSWLGILGPVIRAEVGDTVIVDFLNRSNRSTSIHPHGLRYDKENEGSRYLPSQRGAVVPPNARYTYHWFADEGSGPGPGQLSSIAWWYHSHVSGTTEINAGLLGPIIVTAKGRARPDGSPKGIDREFVTAFVIFDELAGKDAGMFHSINGFVFGNLPGLVMKSGDKVRWHLMGMGNEKDLHTPHWHGKTVSDGSRHVDVVDLLPGSTITVDMLADNPGVWMFHCHVADHMEAGMMATYTIYASDTRSCPLQFTSGDFWNNSKYSVTVKNTSGHRIKQYSLTFEHFLAPQYLHHPYQSTWAGAGPIGAGEEQSLERDSNPKSDAGILGWALFPSQIEFDDGSRWVPQHHGECFHVFWRDPGQPDLPVLPPPIVNVQTPE